MDFYTILFCVGGVRAILGLVGFGVLEFVECIRDVAGHAERACVLVIIPVQVDTTESFASPINVDLLVMVVEALDEMVSMFFADVFNAKVVHDEAKTDGAPFVAPEAGRVADRCVAIGAEETGQLLFGEDAGLRKTIHAASYLDVDSSIVDKVSEFVVRDDFFGDRVDRDEHVLVIIHWCA